MVVRELAVVFPWQGVVRHGLVVEPPLEHLGAPAVQKTAERAAGLQVAIRVKDVEFPQLRARGEGLRHFAARTVNGHRDKHRRVVAPLRHAGGKVVEARHCAHGGVDKKVALRFVELQDAADFADALLHRVLLAPRTRLAPLHRVAPRGKHLAAARAKVLPVPNLADEILDAAPPD